MLQEETFFTKEVIDDDRLCDREHEPCPSFPGEGAAVYWNIPDPVAVEGSEEERYRTFQQLALELNTRVRLLLALLERQRRGG